MKLYHCVGSRSVRVFWMLEELGLRYEIEVLPFDPAALTSADCIQLEGKGRVPVLVIDAVTMYESVPIVQYLLDHYADGRLEPPRGSDEYGVFLRWMTYGEETLMGPVSKIARNSYALPPAERSATLLNEGKRRFKHFARKLEDALEQHDYLYDDQFTAADIVVGYALYVANEGGALPEDYPKLRAYYERLAARPAFKKAVAG
ncbi:MAG TPA: glutathione S-transferase family protein [Gammaproteobacteria bacterium]|nr:glutathione S-transferase family protein [Gammaproteobacteria bacterium]